MRIQVIGLGVVGSAQAYLAKHLGHEVYGVDRVPIDLPCLKERSSLPFTGMDITFVCTPEATVPSVVEHLCDAGLPVIKSTVPLGTTLRLQKSFGHVCHNPEFLREKHSLEDVCNPSRIVIGQCCEAHGNLLEQFYEPLNRPVYRTDPTSSELIKLASNSLRAVSISFWNELSLLAEKVGADINLVARAADPAKVIGEWEGGAWGTRRFGEPYDGKCLPKDLLQLINGFLDNGLNPEILVAADRINRAMGEKT